MVSLGFEISLVLYLVAVVVGVVELLRSTRFTSRLMLVVVGVAFLIHTVALVQRYVVAGYLPISNPHEATSFFSWCIVFLFLVLEFRYKVGLLGSFVMPLVLFMMLASAVLPREIKPLNPMLQSYWLWVHTFLAFMANAAFALACGLGVMYLIQERFVKKKHLGGLFHSLPSLQGLDDLQYRLISLGFPLFTFAMVTGMLWADSAWGSYWRWDPREVWALITWLIYAIIIHARMLKGWRGRRAAVLSIIGFSTILIAFFGIKLLKKGMHFFQ